MSWLSPSAVSTLRPTPKSKLVATKPFLVTGDFDIPGYAIDAYENHLAHSKSRGDDKAGGSRRHRSGLNVAVGHQAHGSMISHLSFSPASL